MTRQPTRGLNSVDALVAVRGAESEPEITGRKSRLTPAPIVASNVSERHARDDLREPTRQPTTTASDAAHVARENRTTSPTDPTVDAPSHGSLGQRLLCALDVSGPAIAARIGVSKQIVSAWRRGSKRPSLARRGKLEADFGIPFGSWLPFAEVPELVRARRAELAETRELIDTLERTLAAPLIAASTRRALFRDVGKAVARRARLESVLRDLGVDASELAPASSPRSTEGTT